MKNISFSGLARRTFLSLSIAAGLAFLTVPFAGVAQAADKPLILCFSKTGNTQKVADEIQKLTGADMIQIEPEQPYPDDYKATTEIAKKEQESNARPAVKTKVDNLADYSVIFLGSPNWWGNLPMPLWTFLEQEGGFQGKTIAPFFTSGGGGLQNCEATVKRLCPDAKVLPPLVINGNRAGSSAAEVEKWLKDNNLLP